MKDKQKRKKERTWAEAARLVRRVAEGARWGAWGWARRALPTGRGRGGVTLPVGNRLPSQALGGERSPTALDMAPFSARTPHL